MATKGEIRARVLRNLGRAGVAQTELDDVDGWINDFIREDICADHSWSGMEFTRTRNTVAGTDTYAFASPSVFKDCRYIMIRDAVGQDYRFLEEITLDALHERATFTSLTEGAPRYWARDADSYVLRPIPDAIYPLRERVYEYPAAFTVGAAGDAASNFVTLYLPKLLEYGVSMRGSLFYGEDEKYLLYQQAYAAEMAKAVGVDRKRLSPAKMTIRPSTRAGTPEPGISAGMDMPYAPYGWANP